MLPTPVLALDLDAVDRNLATAARIAGGVPIRPHFKAHKCVPLLRRQLAAPGHRGVTCATPWEALVLAREGIGDLLVANEVVQPVALAELAEAARLVDVTVAVDSVAGLDALADLPVRVLVDVDVGQGRGGVAAGDPLVVELARRAGSRFLGLMGYDGQAQHADATGRLVSTRRVADLLTVQRARLEAAGLPVALVSGGGTGTLADAAAASVLSEVQAGSYVLMDADYGRLGLPFEPAVALLATVVSRRNDVAVLDAGLKATSAEDGLPLVRRDDAEATGIADEHTTLRLRPGSDLAIGDVVELTPRHLDPTLNLHDAVLAGDELWRVTGRASVLDRAGRGR